MYILGVRVLSNKNVYKNANIVLGSGGGGEWFVWLFCVIPNTGLDGYRTIRDLSQSASN